MRKDEITLHCCCVALACVANIHHGAISASVDCFFERVLFKSAIKHIVTRDLVAVVAGCVWLHCDTFQRHAFVSSL